MSGFLVVFLILVLIVGSVIISGAREAARDPDYPRHVCTTACQQFGESCGWWTHIDMFGYHYSRGEDPPLTTVTASVEELTGQVHTATEAQTLQPSEDWLAPLGGTGTLP